MSCIQSMNRYSNYAIAAGAGAVGFLAVNYAAWVAPKVARYVCKLAENMVYYGKPLLDFSRTHPLHGIIAGLAISLLANNIILFCEKRSYLNDYPLLRRIITHIIAGGVVFGLSLAIAQTGLIASSLTLGSATTLTACALLLDLIYRKVLVCINQGKPIVEELTQLPKQRA